MIHKLLIPLDGSQLAEHALVPGLRLAATYKAAITILGAVEPTNFLVPDAFVMGGYGLTWPNQSEERAREAFTGYFKKIDKEKAEYAKSIRTVIMDGDPASAIVEQAEQDGTDLIVMSSHGYSGLSRWVMGSVAERVLHAAPCPVLISRGTTPPQHMLIPLDGSPLSEEILDTGLEVAQGLGCKVTLLESIEPLSPAEMDLLNEMETGLGGSFQQEQQNRITSYLQQTIKERAGALPYVDEVVVHGSPAQAILDYALNHTVDLIAMSTHGRSGLQRWMYGSVTEKVLRAATACSMLIARPRA